MARTGRRHLGGRVALVSGASSGIGEATAVALAARGATVVALGRRRDRLEATAERCRAWTPGSTGVVADVSCREEAEAAVAEARGRLGTLDILVNNAGMALHRGLDTTVEEVEAVVAVNFLGAVYLAQAALPAMVAAGWGAIVNVTSVAAYVPNPREAAYGASKAALSRWSQGLAVDLRGTGVHVGVLSPGPIDTPMWCSGAEADYPGRRFPPEMVARAVVAMIERSQHHRTVPRRFGAIGALAPLLPGPVRWGLARFQDRLPPAPPEDGLAPAPS